MERLYSILAPAASSLKDGREMGGRNSDKDLDSDQDEMHVVLTPYSYTITESNILNAEKNKNSFHC